ncbi:MAG: DUF3667 domain-containing protein [Betaproteobacteria bacterium]
MTDAAPLPADLAAGTATSGNPQLPAVAPPHCHNCAGAIDRADAFCRHCGQETRIALPTARQFMREAAGRYVAIDGRLWRTMRALMLHPGLLTREYIAGRRRHYVRPGRLFLVLSIVAFAAIRIATHADFAALDRMTIDDKSAVPLAPAAKGAAGDRAVASPKSGDADHDDGVILRSDNFGVSMDPEFNLIVKGDAPAVPLLRERIDRFNRLPRSAKGEQLMANVFRYGPYAAIVLLPAFAMMLMLVYALRSPRHRDRPRRFAAHLVFAAHNHAFLFVLTIVVVLLPFPGWVKSLIYVAAAAYLLQSMRVVYGGGWMPTLVRAFVLFVAYTVLFAIVVAGLLVAAVVLQ